MKTIFGLSTILGRSGVAVIRISGNNALKAAASLGVTELIARKATFAKLSYAGEEIDEAIVIYFKAPHSFTGEDVIELHTHGSRAVIKKILAILGGMENLRMAEAGEFSKRAFENNKMDLTEAEGLADLIDAETEAQAKQAMRQMQGELGKIYDGWRAEMLHVLARIEAYIDFPDEDLPQSLKDEALNGIAKFRDKISEHLNDNRRGEKIREGIFVVILGAPNVGKSSLLNYLAQREAAIVSETAGTTRDVIEVNMELGGYAVTIADTAGLRETVDAIEKEGISRALKKAENADIKIVMQEAGQKLDETTKNLIDSDTIFVMNKVDLSEVAQNRAINISVKSNIGLDKLLEVLLEKISQKFEITESPVITRARHREALQRALSALENLSFDKPIELVAEDLRYAACSLGQITGKIDVDEILGEIFSSFCIGK